MHPHIYHMKQMTKRRNTKTRLQPKTFSNGGQASSRLRSKSLFRAMKICMHKITCEVTEITFVNIFQITKNKFASLSLAF